MSSIDRNRMPWVHGHTGAGKCLGKGTPVLMFNGTIRNVEDVKVGDLLMGPDSTPRKVMSLARGQEPMYRVVPIKGTPYVVNESHILSLRMTNGSKNNCGYEDGSIVNISVREYLTKSKPFKHCAKGWRTGVEFIERAEPLPMEPYFLGVWLGDGVSANSVIWNADPEVAEYLEEYAARLGLSVRYDKAYANRSPALRGMSITKTGGAKFAHPLRHALRLHGLIPVDQSTGLKHIPHAYKTASREERLQVLAGIIDTDGSLDSSGGYDLTLKSERLMDDVIFVARSLGFAAYKAQSTKKCHNNGVVGRYFRCNINGDIDQVPCRIARKKAAPRKQIKNVLNTGISVEPIGVGDYYGFEVSGTDRLFLLRDFTVTHNTTMIEQVCDLG